LTSPDETDPSLLRAIDANFNRAREALRVVEDVARFVWDDAAAAAELKDMRHALRSAVEGIGIPSSRLLHARDSARDVGRDKPAPDERARDNVAALVTANVRRGAEALRVLEEATKVPARGEVNNGANRGVSEGVGGGGGRFEKLRFRLYDLEKRFLVSPDIRRRLAAMRLYVLVSPEETSMPVVDAARASLEGGADVVQLRMKHASDTEILDAARAIAPLARSMGRLFIVNDRPDLAAASKADGVHLGDNDLPIEDARRILSPGAIVGLSTHSPREALDAQRRGADVVAVGPVFKTPIKSFRKHLGPKAAADIASSLAAPAVLIGGIDEDNLPQLTSLGVRAVAVCRAVISQQDPAAAARRLRAQLPE